MSGRERCDEILRLIDQALADPGAILLPPPEPTRVPVPRQSRVGSSR